MITAEDWALIGRLATVGVPKVRIAKRLAISPTTVVKLAARNRPPSHLSASLDRQILRERRSPGEDPAGRGG